MTKSQLIEESKERFEKEAKKKGIGGLGRIFFKSILENELSLIYDKAVEEMREKKECLHYLHGNPEFMCPSCEHVCLGGVIEKGDDKFCSRYSCKEFNLRRNNSNPKGEK
ncbi:MAG TPA: hypothetical protein VIY47_04305 [Ignavibacteriaceae bacterium]